MKAVIPVLLFVLSGCSKAPENKVEAAKPEAPKGEAAPKEVVLDAAMQRQAGVRVETVSLRSVPIMLQTTGKLTLNENRTWRIGAVTDGRIVRVQANPGDAVRKEQILAGMHSHEIHEGRAAYRKALTDQSRAEAGVAHAQRLRDRAQRLLELKAGSQEHLDIAEAELRNAKTALENAVTETQRCRRHLVEFLEVSLEEHDDHAEGEQEHDSDLIPIKSPAAGVLIERKVTAGSVASAGDELFVVSDLATLWMIASAPEEQLGKLRAGMAVRVTVQAYPNRVFQGKILRLGEQFDPETRTIPVRVELANMQGLLKPEMYAAAEFGAGTSAPAVFIPPSAIQQIEDKPAVFVQAAPNRFEPRFVETGAAIGGLIEIRQGVRPGDSVVVEGSYTLKSQLLKASLAE